MLSYDPSLEKSHHETCEKSKNDRKRVVQNGTKRLARFEDKYRPKWESIMKESITPISERKISNEDAVDVLTQMEKDFLAIKYRRVYTPRILKNSNARTKTVTSAPKNNGSKDATKNSEVEAEADVIILRRTPIKRKQNLDHSKKSNGPKNKKQKTKKCAIASFFPCCDQ